MLIHWVQHDYDFYYSVISKEPLLFAFLLKRIILGFFARTFWLRMACFSIICLFVYLPEFPYEGCNSYTVKVFIRGERAFSAAAPIATVSVKIVGTLLCLLVPSMLLYEVWWLNRDKQLWEGRGEHEKGKNSVWLKCPNFFCLRLCWGGIWRRVDGYEG